MLARRAALVVTIAIAVVACKKSKNDPGDPNNPTPGESEDTTLAEDGSDSTLAELDSETLTSTLINSGSTSGSIGLADVSGGDLQTQTVGDGVKAIYFPRGCVVVTPAPTDATSGEVKYDFTNCTGPAGLLNLSGEVHGTYKLQPDINTVTLDFVGTNLRVNKATIDWTAHAVIVADGANRLMTWHAQLSGTTARGRELTRTNDKKVKWTVGEPCLALEGVSEGHVANRGLRTEITAFRRCRGSCPDAGGKIVVTNTEKQKSIEIDYDGTNQATLIGPNGEKTQFGLLCR